MEKSKREGKSEGARGVAKVSTRKMDISLIICIRNQEEVAVSQVQSILEAMKGMQSYEILIVDDASTDGTVESLRPLAGQPHVKLLRMRAPAGLGAALKAGLGYSVGKKVLFYNAKVLVNPEVFPQLVEALRESELVMGWRTPRRDSVLNRGASWLFNRMARSVQTTTKLHDINSGVFGTYRYVLERIVYYGDLYNFIPAMAMQQGYKVSEIKVEQLPGKFRKSIYAGEYLQRLLDILTVIFLSRYSKKPIHFLGFVGSVFIVAGFSIEMYLFIYRILGMGPIAGRPLLLLGAILLVIGIQMISIGLIGEMIIFTHAGDIDEYNIEEIV
jgi:glycosyltransferase involved in cell wall biosynthesis